MSDVLQYKGYYGSVDYDRRDDILHGRLLGISDVISYEGTSINELKQDFQSAVDDYLDACGEAGKKPEKPFSGRFQVRIPRELHTKVALAAKSEGKSINAWVSDALDKATHSDKA
jgi:predicted HicB family RNase H-like nuclease